MLNIPGVEGLKVEGAAAVPKLRVGVVDCDAVKLNPVAAKNKKSDNIYNIIKSKYLKEIYDII